MRAAFSYYQSFGITVGGVMTDNGSWGTFKAFREACAMPGIRHNPYQAQHFHIQRQSQVLHADRNQGAGLPHHLPEIRGEHNPLPVWLHHHNWHRSHNSLMDRVPTSRLSLSENNLLTVHN